MMKRMDRMENDRIEKDRIYMMDKRIGWIDTKDAEKDRK